MIVGPAVFISAWIVSGVITEGYSPTRDHISDLAAIGVPTRTLMNAGFTVFAVAVGLAASPLRRHIDTPAAVVLGANGLLQRLLAVSPRPVTPSDIASIVRRSLGT